MKRQRALRLRRRVSYAQLLRNHSQEGDEPVRLVARRARERVQAIVRGVEWRVWDGVEVKVLVSSKLERQSATHAPSVMTKDQKPACDWPPRSLG